MKNYKWTTASGENYEVKESDGYFLLYVNCNYTQQCLKNTVHFEEAVSRLVNNYNDANEAERMFFKNNPQLNP